MCHNGLKKIYWESLEERMIWMGLELDIDFYLSFSISGKVIEMYLYSIGIRIRKSLGRF